MQQLLFPFCPHPGPLPLGEGTEGLRSKVSLCPVGEGVRAGRLLLFSLLLLFLLSGCTALAEKTLASGSLLWSDSFNPPANSWGSLDNEGARLSQQPGALRLQVFQPNSQAWTHPGLRLGDVRLQVSVRANAEPFANRMGLVCRMQDEINFYFFFISADGYAAIGKMQQGRVAWLTKLQKAAAVETGLGVNHLQAECVADFLVFTVNDTLTLAAQDAAFVRGDVGLLAGTFEQAGADVLFDNFNVFKP